MATEIDVDEADVLVYTQGLERANRLTTDINKSLKNIALTSSHSSRLFTPILSRNNMLSTLQRNIESTLNSVSSIKDLANDASRHEIILSKGFKNVGLKQYIQAVHKLDDMLDDIKGGKEKHADNAEFAGMLSHLTGLIRSSEVSLRKYFVALLTSIKPFDPQININKKMPFPYYSDEQLNDMVIILDYFHNASDDSTAIDKMVADERCDWILKCMAFLEPFAKQINVAGSQPYEKGTSGLNSYAEALLGFIANEKSFVDDLYVQESDMKPIVFCNIVIPLITAYTRLVNLNLDYVRSNLANTGILIFELADSIHNVKRILRGTPLENTKPMEDCAGSVHKVTQLLFKEVIQHVESRVNSMASIPADNGVTEATVETMSRLRKFSGYSNGCLEAMESITRESWLPMNFRGKETTLPINSELPTPQARLSCFFSDCIDVLIVSLERKSQKLLMPNREHEVATPNSKKNDHKPRIGFFIIMNMTLIEQIVEKSEINQVLGTEGRSRLDKLKKRYVNYMVADWRQLATNLMDSVFVDSTGKISSKDKDQIKEKFHKFNEGFEELVSKYKQYRLSDPGLKSTLKSEIVSLVMPMYDRFYRRYKDSFKNPRKHIKYTPSELTSILDQVGR
ncbi:hypothetical protein ZYGR_0AD03860 [Zygosaccharomyces rouxii]|uniref:Exocyst complex protein EXO70 n=2 Tax=Zygosaccharomyces rouxii TaxID=4956 RepID=C5E0R8_ZYGRC|nr:uncharacterized protein ZYRO0G15048g [Zygosaccharomyces rouxii]KAH9202696.1 Cullin repeat-like-containing domain protein [Zygosaccharomyces rouxii]GAV51203.1 hypothetical protein ZYGR_0AD03860 [Zygosaccharomyces rouxii]CAR29702.1 ZYRO0G15048p [Zygosaccharomyces rouxii]